MKTFLVVSSALTVLAFVGTAALLERAFRRAKRHPE